MWVRFLDKSLTGFIKISIMVILFFFIAIVFFVLFYQYSTINTYNYILLFLTIMTILITLFVVLTVIAVYFTYKSMKANKLFVWLIKVGLKVLMPLIIHITGVFKGDIDGIRRFYIDLNNMLVEQIADKGYLPKDIMVILPHCLQNSNCRLKVIGNLENCQRCGKCCIGGIADISKELGVGVEIVTGGTAARNIISLRKPKIIISVACERDLTSGISDITGIPVLGIINIRPNGPCSDTSVNVQLIRERLESMVK